MVVYWSGSRISVLVSIFCPTFFFFQAEDGIRDLTVTGVQTCALPIWLNLLGRALRVELRERFHQLVPARGRLQAVEVPTQLGKRHSCPSRRSMNARCAGKIGRASCRERV